MTAVQREVSPDTASRDVPGPEIRAGYRRFAGFRTRVLEVGPRRPADGDPPRRRGRRRPRQPVRPATPPRLVLLHGYCDSADTWLPVLERLAAEGHSAVAVDLPGFGHADPLRPGPMLPQLDAFTAAVVREQAVLGDVVLAGNSLGGTMSLRAAQSPRLPVSGVVSIAAPGLVDSWLVRIVGRYPLPLRLYSALPLPVPGFVVRTVARQVVPRLLYADARSAADEHVRRFTELFPDYRSTTTRLEQARQLVGELAEAYQPDRIGVPLLVVACGKDRLVSAASGRQLHSLVPHSRLLVREDWGHCPQLDDPAAIAELLTYFAAGARFRTATGTTGAGDSSAEAAG
ncbi:pimeloyl-ACP methyl ester carboxylesterase [Prauserella shujinwangii]|uniref:Pimeloyl-ACP methyl ester carboxylesterase n=1 Tax=Prauserella shujinwangii TaxID=1453103 RepID=A0A2T0LU34_9PSEU|nr:alpha/beta hydrolase [Prauserella shujinwangii]PRX47241.1 pimeloyl-ACP methyl ester carboxylesterase [Prauserella shujinwangii]